MKKFIDTLKIKKPEFNRLSYSSLKAFNKSPIDYLMYLNKEYVQNDSMLLGSVVDCLLLTPNEFEDKYILVDDYDRRTKIGKELHIEYTEKAKKLFKTIVKKSMLENAEIMVNSLLNNNKVKLILDNTTQTQYPIDFTYKLERAEKYQIRGFADGVGEMNGKPFIFDLKTTNNIDQHFYTRQIIDMLYHLQASIYCMGFAHDKIKIPDFYHIVIENKAPYKCNVYKFDKEFIKRGKTLFKNLVMDFDHCKLNDLWEMGQEFFEPNINEIEMPIWYENKKENEQD